MGATIASLVGTQIEPRNLLYIVCDHGTCQESQFKEILAPGLGYLFSHIPLVPIAESGNGVVGMPLQLFRRLFFMWFCKKIIPTP